MLMQVTEYTAETRIINVASPAYFKDYGTFYCVNEKGNILHVGASFVVLTTQVNRNYNEELQKVLTCTPIKMEEFYTAWQNTMDKIEAAVLVK